nr:unnamed protein product [Callosobruchus chinensis]
MQKNNKYKSIKSNQENLRRSETTESCNSRTCQNQPPEKITSHVKVLLKADAGSHRCEICGEITEYTIAKIEQARVLSDYSKRISKNLHILCDLCLAHILTQSSAKSDASIKCTGRVMPCCSSTLKCSRSRKDNESNSHHASCNTATESKPSSKCPNLEKAEKPYEMCYTKCSTKSKTSKKRLMLCSPNSRSNTKSENKREKASSKPKGGDIMCNKKIKVDQKSSTIRDIENTECHDVPPFTIEDHCRGLSERKVSTGMVNDTEMRDTVASSPIEMLSTVHPPENFEVFNNITEYSKSDYHKESYTSSAKERELTPKISFDTQKSAGVCKHSNSRDCPFCCKCGSKEDVPVTNSDNIYEKRNANISQNPSVQEIIATIIEHCIECATISSFSCNKAEEDTAVNTTRVENKVQSIMICESWQPCYPSVQESIASREQHCVECADPTEIECDNCLSSNYEDNTLEVLIQKQISSDGCQYAATCCECEDYKENHPEMSEVINKDQSLMICETCVPCYPSVQKSIASREQHCIECADPAKIECENCLIGDYEDKNAFAAASYTEEDLEVSEKNQSLMICETCEPCYPSVRESRAARQSHCIQCSKPSNIECESCLNETNESSQFSKVAIDTQISSQICQDTSCCTCEIDEKVSAGSYLQVHEEIDIGKVATTNEEQSQMICEPCYSSSQETMEVHCIECPEADKIVCESCLKRINESNRFFPSCSVTFQAPKVPVETQISSQRCECEHDKITPTVASDIANQGQINCDSCKNKQSSRMYANVSTKISFTRFNKETQCQDSEFQSSNSCLPKEDCQLQQCCERDDDFEPETMDDETVCVHYEPCKQSIDEKKYGNGIHCLECSNPIEILCDSCLKIASEHDGPIKDNKSATSFKCNECISEKCAPTNCSSCEDKSTDMNSKVSEINSVTYCKTCEQCKDSFSKSSGATRCSACADIKNIQRESYLQIGKEESYGIKEDQLDAKLIYELVCETCEQLSGDKDRSDKKHSSIKRFSKTNDSCTFKIDVKCSKTDCGDSESNNNIIDAYFNQPESSKSGKYGNTKTSILFAGSTENYCPHCNQIISQQSMSEGLQKKNSNFGCNYCEACEDCQSNHSSEGNRKHEDNCLDRIDSNNILCESCLNLTNKQNRTARLKSQSSQKSQLPSKTYRTPEVLTKANSSNNTHDENCTCCLCRNRWSTKKNARNLREEIATEKHSAITHNLNETIPCSCSSRIGSKKQQIASCSRGINNELQDVEPHITPLAAQEQTTRCCLEAESVKCAPSKDKQEHHDVISVTISDSISDTFTGYSTSNIFEDPKRSFSQCSTHNVLELDAASISCQDLTSGQAGKSKPKCSCHVSTNTSTLTTRGADRYLEHEGNPLRKVANSPKGECGAALKYKLSSNDRASDYVLLDGPVFIKKSCVGGKYKVGIFATKLVFKCILRCVNQLQVQL